MKPLFLTAIAVLAVSTALLTGCANGEMSEAEIEEVVAEILAANTAVDTVAFDLTMDGEITVEADDVVVEDITIVAEGSGVVDSAAEQMHIALTMDYVVPGEDPLSVPVEYFLTDGWMYISMVVPGDAVQWMKMQVPEEMWDKQNEAQKQVDMLREAEKVTFLGMEDVNGVKCYAVEVIPDLATVSEMMTQMQGQMSQFGEVDLSQMDAGSMLKELSVTQYIAADTHLFTRTDEHIVMAITPESLGLPSEKFDRITEDMTTSIVFRDYGKPVTIQLPQGALAATQMG